MKIETDQEIKDYIEHIEKTVAFISFHLFKYNPFFIIN